MSSFDRLSDTHVDRIAAEEGGKTDINVPSYVTRHAELELGNSAERREGAI